MLCKGPDFGCVDGCLLNESKIIIPIFSDDFEDCQIFRWKVISTDETAPIAMCE